jgi:tetratricopeptide (TPR) repeat protein
MEQMMYTWLDIQRHVMMDDLEGARTILRGLSHSTRTDEYTASMAPYAAYLSRDYALAISKWDEIKEEALSSTDHQDDMLEYVMLGVAFAYRQQDDYEAADALIKRVGLNLAKRVSGTNPVDASVWYRYALYHALEGKSQMALMSLQRAIDEGWVDHWQPQVEPALQGLLPQSDMQNMLAGLQTRLNLSREQYAFDKSFAAAGSAEPPGS